jgi:hypothetical protein
LPPAYDSPVTKAKLLAALAAMLLAGCQAASTTSGGPSAAASAASSAESEAPASAPGSPGESVSLPPESNETIDRSTTNGILPPDSLALVMVDGLRVRETPSLTGRIMTSFPAGTRVQVPGNPSFLGPVTADGYDWYVIVHRSDEDDPATEILGYAAAGDPAGPFLATLKPRCDRAALITLTGFERLACLGGGPVTIEGTYGCGECGGLAPGTFVPEWLAHPIFPPLPVLTAKPGTGIGRIDIHFPPEAGLAYPEEGSIIRLVGHFDDAAATTCEIAAGEPEVPADARAAVMYCRERLVVDSYQVIGTDPSYPGV